MKIPIDYLHVGLHKTGSTFLQAHVFSEKAHFNYMNGGALNDVFKNGFLRFDRNSQQKFLEQIDVQTSAISIISEENLTGGIIDKANVDFRNGVLHTYEVEKRLGLVSEYFEPKNIIIVLRYEADFLYSAYSNYILHGGTENLPDWFTNNLNTIRERLNYHSTITQVKKSFPSAKIFIFNFEFLFDDQIFNFFKLDAASFTNIKVNVGRGLLGNNIGRCLNYIFPHPFKGKGKLLSVFQQRPQDIEEIENYMVQKGIGEIIKKNKNLFSKIYFQVK